MNPINTPRMARTLHPDMLFDEGLFSAEQSSGLPVRMVYLALHTIADREGRFPMGPRTTKILMLDEEDRVISAIKILRSLNKIQTYHVDQEQFGVICYFAKLQHINPRERQSLLPAPPVLLENKPAASEASELIDATVQTDQVSYNPEVKEPESPAMESIDGPEFDDGLPETAKSAKKNSKNEPIDWHLFKHMHGDTYWRTSLERPEDPPVIVTKKGDLSECVAVFHVTGPTVKLLGISEAKAHLYDDVYPNADNIARIKKAAAWSRDNAAKRKTPQGLMRFINYWMSSSQDKGDFLLGNNGLALAPTGRGQFTPKPTTDSRIQETAAKMGGIFGRKPVMQTTEHEIKGETLHGAR